MPRRGRPDRSTVQGSLAVGRFSLTARQGAGAAVVRHVPGRGVGVAGGEVLLGLP
jgi:hypothetical protein